jgi:hypothetical protein
MCGALEMGSPAPQAFMKIAVGFQLIALPLSAGVARARVMSGQIGEGKARAAVAHRYQYHLISLTYVKAGTA